MASKSYETAICYLKCCRLFEILFESWINLINPLTNVKGIFMSPLRCNTFLAAVITWLTKFFIFRDGGSKSIRSPYNVITGERVVSPDNTFLRKFSMYCHNYLSLINEYLWSGHDWALTLVHFLKERGKKYNYSSNTQLDGWATERGVLRPDPFLT